MTTMRDPRIKGPVIYTETEDEAAERFTTDLADCVIRRDGKYYKNGVEVDGPLKRWEPGMPLPISTYKE